jgi:undecaprenyl diphosphate synthase
MKPAPSHADAPAPPKHVAIIMDGNGRWAQARGLPRVAGHRQGAEAVRRTIRAAIELGISYLTLYGFSLENWKRPANEIVDLMGLLRLYLREEVNSLDEQGVRIRFIGERHRLAPDIIRLIGEAEEQTRRNLRLNLIVAISYGARQEIIGAVRRVAQEVAAGRLDPGKVTEEVFAGCLETAGVPDPDLLIRTSGEKRISNFLLWQSAYTELVFVDTRWPDFSEADLADAVREFGRRERRYGATGV